MVNFKNSKYIKIKFILNIFILFGIILLFISNRYREIFLMRFAGFLYFNKPLIFILIVIFIDAIFTKIKFKKEFININSFYLLLFTFSLSIFVLGLFDANPYEPNISRRLIPFFNPMFFLLMSYFIFLRIKNTFSSIRLLYFLSITFYVIFSILQYRQFLNYSDMDSVNKFIFYLKKAVPNNAILVVDRPEGLYDTAILFFNNIDIVKASSFNKDEFKSIVQFSKDNDRPLYILLSEAPSGGFSKSYTYEIIKTEITKCDFVAKNISFVWEDISNIRRFPSRKNKLKLYFSLCKWN